MTLPGETLASGADPRCPDCGKMGKLDVYMSAAGYYIGTYCDCGPYTRESDYYPTHEIAERALRSGVYGRAGQLSLDDVLPLPEPRAHARNTDPVTSHEAADSVRKIRESQAAVLRTFERQDYLTDVELVRIYHEHPQSVSGLRTRRRELVDLGRIEDSGLKTRLPSGRRAIVWRLS